MTHEENMRRSTDANVNFIKNNICDRNGDKSYVFISYKSDDWEIVLHDIVYRLVKDYGLNVYFDGSFDSHNSLWVNQFPDNMGDYKCKGVIAFFDDNYATSYATLMELLYSQTKKAAIGKSDPNGLPIVPVDLAKLTNVTGKLGQRDTGLGVDIYEDGSVNVNAANELALFTKSFKELVKRKILRDAEFIWDPGDKLDAMTCSQIVWELKAYKKINENYYSSGMSLDGIVGSIKNACGAEVFSTIEPVKVQVRFKSEDKCWSESVQVDIKIPEPAHGEKAGYKFMGWFLSETEKKWDFSKDIVSEDITLIAEWKKLPSPGVYEYTIFGKEYTAGKGEQGKLMFDAFEALMERYPECGEKLTNRTSVARAEDVKKPNTQEAHPTYFKGCKSFEVNGQKYLVGTSYGFKAKLAEIKGMFKLCEADLNEFVLNGKSLGDKSGDGSDNNEFKYELWNISHTANSLADMIHDVFDLVAEKYASSIPDMADNDSITSVARKSDVDGEKLPPKKLNYFKTKKEHIVGGMTYYVSTSYNREQGIKQIEKMLALCEGHTGAFNITAVPDKSTRNGKKSIEELI